MLITYKKYINFKKTKFKRSFMNNTNTYITINLFYLKSLFLLFILNVHNFEINAQNEKLEYKKFFHPNGQISSEGYFENNKPIGVWKSFSEDGVLISEGARKKFKPDSIWNFYYPNGGIQQKINYSEGIKQGVYEEYNVDGKITLTAINDSNILTGEAISYDYKKNNYLTFTYKKGKKNGFAYLYDTLDLLIAVREYKNNILTKNDIINRYNSANLKTGLWQSYVDVNSKKILIEEAKYVNGLLNGYLKKYNVNGELIVLEKYKDGVLVIDAAEVQKLDEVVRYYKNGKLKYRGIENETGKQGYWQFYNSDGTQDKVELYVNNKMIGKGKLNFNGQKEGLWEHYYPDGRLQSKGEYLKGVKINEWVYYYHNGKIQQKGEFNDIGQYNGIWIWYYKNGNILKEEEYYNDAADGPAIEYDSLGVVITKGSYIDGLKTGEWVYHVNDHKEIGKFVDGKKIGLWNYYYLDDHLLFEGEFLNGVENGKHIYYYESGKKKEMIEYSTGMINGTRTLLKENGETLIIYFYKNDILIKIDGVKVKHIK